jgi:hypothetical protein
MFERLFPFYSNRILLLYYSSLTLINFSFLDLHFRFTTRLSRLIVQYGVVICFLCPKDFTLVSLAFSVEIQFMLDCRPRTMQLKGSYRFKTDLEKILQ